MLCKHLNLFLPHESYFEISMKTPFYFLFAGSVDTNWGIEATLERKLLPFPFTFALSGMASLANFQKPQYRYGIGLIIGS